MFGYFNQNLFPETGTLFNRLPRLEASEDFKYSGPKQFNYRTIQQTGALTQPMEGLRRTDQMGLTIELQAQGLNFKSGDIIRVNKYGKELEFTIRAVSQVIDERNNEQYLNLNRSWPGMATDNMIYVISLSNL